MNIAVIGAGHVGGAVTRGATKAGHIVRVSSAHGITSRDLAEVTGATAATTNAEAAEHAGVIVLAVPYGALAQIAEEIRVHAAGKPVIEVSNPVNEDLSGVRVATSAAEELQEMLPDSYVVKALNTVFAANMATGRTDHQQLDAYYAGDHHASKERVAELLADLGFAPLDIGPLVMARVLEAMGLLIIRLNRINGWQWRNGWKLVGPR